MINDIFLFAIFCAGILLLWYRVSVRLPQLIAIPDQVITERLREDSARFRLFFLHLRLWYREGHYGESVRIFFGKTLYRFHIVLLRLDNGTMALLKKVKGGNGSLNGNGEYFRKLREASTDRDVEVAGVEEHALPE